MNPIGNLFLAMTALSLKAGWMVVPCRLLVSVTVG